MHEILSTEQPCVLCAQPIEVVTWSHDPLTGDERIDRTRLDHSSESCAATLALYRETFPHVGAT